MKRKIFSRFTSAFAALLIASGAHAALIVTAVESGGDVVFSSSGGSLDLTGFTAGSSFSDVGSSVRPIWGQIFLDDGVGAIDTYAGSISGPASYGIGSLAVSSSSTGGGFGIRASGPSSVIWVPGGYVSGSVLGAATATWAGETYASLGITPGTYVWTLPNDTFTLNVSQVPSPTAIWFFGPVLAILGWMRRRSI